MSTVTQSEETTITIKHYITSLSNVSTFATAARAHWGVENGLHWTLDVVFKEDSTPARSKNANRNLNTLRKIVINTLKKLGVEKGESVAKQRKMCMLSEEYFINKARAFINA